MSTASELGMVVENGLLRPDTPLHLPEHTRLRVVIRRIEVTPESALAGLESLRQIRTAGMVRLGGWRPIRDDMHERD